MNAERILEFVTALLALDAKHAVQQKVAHFTAAMGNLVANAQHPPHQQEMVTKLQDLRKTFAALDASITPAQFVFLEDVGMIDFFSSYGMEDLDAAIKANPMTPSVANDHVAKWSGKRSEIIEKLRQLKQSLEFIHIKADELKPGEAELGFQIPRSIFHNALGEFSVELKVLDRIVGFVSEAVIGSKEPIQVKQISTSDPMIFIQTAIPVVVAVGALVTWLLDCQERTLRIRKLKTEAKETGHPEEGIKLFDKQIEDQIKDATDKKIAELLAASEPKRGAGRKPELEAGLKWAIDSLFARVERGMTVEVRFLPPPPKEENAEATDVAEPNGKAAFEELALIRSKLTFSTIEGEPVRQLPPPDPPKKSQADKDKN